MNLYVYYPHHAVHWDIRWGRLCLEQIACVQRVSLDILYIRAIIISAHCFTVHVARSLSNWSHSGDISKHSSSCPIGGNNKCVHKVSTAAFLLSPLGCYACLRVRVCVCFFFGPRDPRRGKDWERAGPQPTEVKIHFLRAIYQRAFV